MNGPAKPLIVSMAFLLDVKEPFETPLVSMSLRLSFGVNGPLETLLVSMSAAAGAGICCGSNFARPSTLFYMCNDTSISLSPEFN